MNSILIILLPLLAYCQQEIKFGETYHGFISPWRGNTNDVYNVRVQDKIEGEDLIFMVKSHNARGDPNLYISLINPTPTTPEQAEILICDAKGVDICVLESSKVQGNAVYHVGVVCVGHCRYTFKVLYEKEQSMTQNDIHEFKMENEENAEIINIKIEALNFDVNEFEIETKVLNLYQLEEPFYSFLGENEIPTLQKNIAKGSDTYSGSQIIRLKRSQIKEFTTYKLVIQAPAGSIVEVVTRTFGKIRQISLYEDVEDIVNQNEYSLFLLDVSNFDYKGQNEALNIHMEPYTGSAQLYVHPDTQPGLLDQYLWKFNDTRGEDLVILPEELNEIHAKGEKYYIAVYGVEGTCSFTIITQTINERYMVLENNKPTHGRLTGKQIVNYLIIIQGEQEQQIRVQLTALSGNSDMILKTCQQIGSCLVDQDDINNRKLRQSEASSNIFLYSDNDGNDLVQFTTNPTHCQKMGITYSCVYVVGIYPRDESQATSTYAILVQTNDDHILLQENTPHKHFVAKGLNNYYKFIVNENDNMHVLFFSINPIQGDPIMYISKTNQRPLEETADRISDQNIVAYGGRSGFQITPGTYYVTIHGKSASLYEITAQVFRQWGEMRQQGKFDWHYTQIFEGQEHKYHTEKGQNIYLKVDISHEVQLMDYKEPIQIELEEIMGNARMYVFNHPEIDTSKAIYSNVTEVIISEAQTDFDEMVYIHVVPIGETQDVTFQIALKIGNKDQILSIGHSYYGHIAKGSTQQFKLNYFSQQDITLTKHADIFDQNKLIVHVNLIDNTIKTMQGESSLIIKGYELPIDGCRHGNQKEFLCQLKLNVIAEESTFFGLLAINSDSVPKLTDGYPVKRPIPSEFDNFYLFTGNGQTEILVHSDSGELQILAKVFKSKPQTSQEYIYPKSKEDSDNDSLSSEHYLGSSLLIQTKECNNQCLITLTIKKAHPEQSSYFGDYTIYYTSSIIPIMEGIQYTGTVPQNGMKYYKIKNSDPDRGFMVVVTPLSAGDPDIYVSKDKLPTDTDYQWSSQNFQGDQLIIEPVDDMTGTYYIGIFGFSETQFTLQIRFGNLQLFQIYKGNPINIVLKSPDLVYFNYLHLDNKPFQVLLSINRGSGLRYFIDTYQDKKDIDKALNKELNNYQFQSLGQEFKNITQSDSWYCYGCYYMIVVQPAYNLDFQITILVENEFIYLMNNFYQLLHVQKDEVQNFRYFTKQGFKLLIKIFSGDIDLKGFFNGTETSNTTIQTNFKKSNTTNPSPELYATYIEAVENAHLYQMRVQGNEYTIYSIQCVSDISVQEITTGQLVSFDLDKNDSIKFKFTTQTYRGRFSIFVETEGSSINEKQKSLQHPLVELLREYQLPNSPAKQYMRILSVDDFKTDTVHYLEYNEYPSAYQLIIHSQSSGKLSHHLLIGTSAMNSLISEREVASQSTVGEIKKWEIHVPYPARIFIQAQLCGGIIELLGATKPELIERGQYDQIIKHVHNKQLIGAFNVTKPGMYYIGSQLIRTTHLNDIKGAYTLTPFILQPNSYIPYDEIEPGQGGEIGWDLYKSGDVMNLVVNVGTVEKNTNDNYTYDSAYYYLVYDIRELDDDRPFDYCSITSKFNSVIANKEKEETSVQITQEFDHKSLQNKRMLFTVLARVKVRTNNYEILYLDYYYNQEQIQGEDVRNAHIKHYGKYLVGFIFLAGLITILCLYNRNRNLQKRLKYEISGSSNQQALAEQNIELHYRGFQDS